MVEADMTALVDLVGTGADAAALDAADPLAGHRDTFVRADDPELPAYLDGNSLGRPLKATAQRMADLVDRQWGSRLIRSWDEGWFDLPETIGDRIAAITLGAAAGQTTVGDSTTVSLYKLIRSALAARPGRDEIVVDHGNFPTDRYIVEGIAAETGATVRWLEPGDLGEITVDDVRAVVGERTAVVVLSHVSFRTASIADVPGITAVVHDAGALILWDLCHSVGVVPMQLDAWDVDFAVGCTYKYLNGGPGSPAFMYVAERLLADATQPIWGWMGVRDAFGMGAGYQPAVGIRRFISGTPAVQGMQGMQDMLDLIESVGIDAVRAKAVALTEFAIRRFDDLLAPLGAGLASPRDADVRGGHITITHDTFRVVTARLWEQGVIPDFRPPNGIRLGLSPLSTSFAEVEYAMQAIRRELAD